LLQNSYELNIKKNNYQSFKFKNMKKALKINVEAKTITEILIDDSISSIVKEIGNNCNYFCCPYEFANADTIYADDESLLRRDDIRGGFMITDTWVYPIVGNAIILGTDEEGDSIDCKTKITDLENIIFVGEKECKLWSDKVMQDGIMVASFSNLKN
jgi:hypothetical protein